MNAKVTRDTLAIAIAGAALGAMLTGCSNAQDAAHNAAGSAGGAAQNSAGGAVSAKLQDILRTNPVTFEPQSAQLPANSTQSLQQIATVLKTSGSTATVTTHAGYADSTQAQQLSEQRADSIAKALQEGGVDSSKIKTQATGNTTAQGDQALTAQISAP